MTKAARDSRRHLHTLLLVMLKDHGRNIILSTGEENATIQWCFFTSDATTEYGHLLCYTKVLAYPYLERCVRCDGANRGFLTIVEFDGKIYGGRCC